MRQIQDLSDDSSIKGEKIIADEPTSNETAEIMETSVVKLNEHTAKESDSESQFLFETYIGFQSQSTQCLHEALKMALRNDLVEIVQTCSYELIQCIGNRTPELTLPLLALYQV